MGTETKWAKLRKHIPWLVKLNNPLMGTETGFINRVLGHNGQAC